MIDESTLPLYEMIKCVKIFSELFNFFWLPAAFLISKGKLLKIVIPEQ